MSERSYLDWPFFLPDHRRLAADLADWLIDICRGNILIMSMMPAGH